MPRSDILSHSDHDHTLQSLPKAILQLSQGESKPVLKRAKANPVSRSNWCQLDRVKW